MIRSSRGERPPFFSGWAKSSSSERSSSRSRSLITPLILEANKGGCALGHPLLPGIRCTDRGQPSSLLLEPDSANGEFFGFLQRQARALRGNHGLDLLQALLAHGLGEDGVGRPEGV